MKVVGVGPAPGYLTDKVKELIKKADTIRGSERALRIVEPFISKNCDFEVIEDFSDLGGLPQDSLLLSTGNPFLSGLGKFGEEVYCGISSFQLASAKLNLSQLNTVPLSLHGREKEFNKIFEQLEIGNKVFLLPDPDFSVEELVFELDKRNFEVDFYLLERLGYPDENIEEGDLDSPPVPSDDLFCIFLVPKKLD